MRTNKEKNNLFACYNVINKPQDEVILKLFWPHDLIVKPHYKCVFVYTQWNKNTVHLDWKWCNVIIRRVSEYHCISLWNLFVCVLPPHSHTHTHTHTHTHSDLLSSKLQIKAINWDGLTEHMDGHCSQWSRRTTLWTNVQTPYILTSTVFHKERARFYDKQPYILEEKGLMNCSMWECGVTSCCRAKLSFPPTPTPQETHVRWDERWSGTGGCIERFSGALIHSLHPSTVVAILWDHMTWSTQARALPQGLQPPPWRYHGDPLCDDIRHF